jgi:hypothetical protein
MSSETPRYLQLHFHHTQIPFSQIVGKRQLSFGITRTILFHAFWSPYEITIRD